MKKRNLTFGVFLGVLALWFAPVHAEDPFERGATEWGLRVGFGDNFHIRGVKEDIEFCFVTPYSGKILKSWKGRRSLELVGEGFLSFVQQDSEDRYAAGITGLIVYNIRESKNFVPFLDLGVGFIYTDLDPKNFGSSFNFTPQGGLGIRYRIGKRKYLTFSYRFHHISNAGTDGENRGINSNFFSVGLSLFR